MCIVIFVTVIIAVHSAALRFLLSRVIGEEWTFVFEGGVAGQRVLGVVFQPSTFGVLLVLSLYLFLKDRLLLSLVAAVVATYFHPTYLLSAGILVCAYLGTIILLDRDIRKAAYVGFTALILVSPVLIYVIRSFALSNQAAQEAQAILVQFRIPHHAIVAAMVRYHNTGAIEFDIRVSVAGAQNKVISCVNHQHNICPWANYSSDDYR